MCARSLEGQLYPGLHQKQRGQQVKGGDSAPLLHSGEIPPGALGPALEPSAQERHGPVGVGPDEGHRNDQRNTSAVKERVRELGMFSLRRGAPGRPYCSLSILQEDLQERWRKTVATGQGVMVLS